MFSPRNLLIGVYLVAVIVLSLAADASAKSFPTMLAQVTPSVCWQSCSTPCDKTYEKCAADAKLNPDQVARCQTALDACDDRCRDQCGLKK